MKSEGFLLGALLLAAAVLASIRSWRLSRWIPIDAEVVHSEPVGPLGLSSARFARQLELQKTGQTFSLGPEIIYYAELVYVVDGVPHQAELAFDGPPDRKFELRFNPRDPREYSTRAPDYSRALMLASLGLALVAYFAS